MEADLLSTFRPLEPGRWGRPETPAHQRRSRWTFSAGYTDTVTLLDAEVEKLGANEFIIEADFREQDIKRDGMPRAGARQPTFPGVRISFESKHGPLQYQTDSCERWEHNLRSIALGLKALRDVDRYGITSRAEQYTGFAAIEGKREMSKADARSAVFRIAGLGVIHGTTDADLKSAWRRARANAHPDALMGVRTLWDELEEAGKVLGLIR